MSEKIEILKIAPTAIVMNESYEYKGFVCPSCLYIIIEKGANFYLKSIPLRKDFKVTKNA